MIKKNLLNKAFETAGESPADIDNIILADKQQLKQYAEKRTKDARVYLKPSEYSFFLTQIGRESFSDIVREFVLLASGYETEDRSKRDMILSLIEKSQNGKK